MINSSLLAKLTDDVIFYGILTKLPTKSLSRFKCVDKSWCAWITSPQFTKLQLLNQNLSTLTEDDLIDLGTLKDQRLFSLPNIDWDNDGDNGLNKLVEMDYPFKSPYTYAYMLGSCNGLLLVQIYDINDTGDPPKYLRLYIWNPCKKDDYITLPPRTYNSLHEYHSYEVTVGFGHDSNADDYKVIIINSSTTTREGIIYTTRTKIWRKIPQVPQDMNFRGNGHSVNEVVHWLGKRKDEERFLSFREDGKRFMIYFDIRSEEWRENSICNKF